MFCLVNVVNDGYPRSGKKSVSVVTDDSSKVKVAIANKKGKETKTQEVVLGAKKLLKCKKCHMYSFTFPFLFLNLYFHLVSL